MHLHSFVVPPVSFVTDFIQQVAHAAKERSSHLRKPKHFYVYIMTNGPRSHVLYTGITGNLSRRVFEHKNKLCPGFTSRYNLTRLVYHEMFVHPAEAIAREKEIKSWRRSKKIALIESMNPHRHDLAAEWQDVHKRVNRVPADPREILHGPEGRSG